MILSTFLSLGTEKLVSVRLGAPLAKEIEARACYDRATLGLNEIMRSHRPFELVQHFEGV
jgi:hypothetical protein